MACRFRAAANLKRSTTSNRYESEIRRCAGKFGRTWQNIIDLTADKGSLCYDYPAVSADYKVTVDEHTEAISNLLGKGSVLNPAAKRCRSSKNRAAAQYSRCRFKAEGRFSKKINVDEYNVSIAACEDHFLARWQRIIDRTAAADAICYDNSLSSSNYKTLIDANTDDISDRLAGPDAPAPIVLTISGSPLTLSTDGSAGSITVTNTSEDQIATNIAADLTDTALEGEVSISSTPCSLLPPKASCLISFLPGSNLVPLTSFTIRGDNTESASAAIDVVAGAVTLSLTGSPLTLVANGPTGTLTITNTSNSVANNIMADFTGTALDGNLTETGNTCASLAPASSCTLTFTPGNTVIPPTNFTIAGSNSNTVVATIEIETDVTLTGINPSSGSASGGVGVTLTGTALTGTTSVTFGGVAATSVNVVNSTTVTAVVPAHAVGATDVEITTTGGSGTLTNGFTFLSTTVGQATSGGIIACLNGGLQNLITASADNSSAIAWGGFGISTNAQSDTDGASNNSTIVAAIGAGTYAAELCDNFEVDSQGNTPCQAGNTCYNDWFLPAKDQLNCLYTNRISIGGFSTSAYFSSTEAGASPATSAWAQIFLNGTQFIDIKTPSYRARCTRSFVP